MCIQESFQHENVFGTHLEDVNKIGQNFYLILTFEVKVYAQKTNSNLNKMYENNLQKVVIFITLTSV